MNLKQGNPRHGKLEQVERALHRALEQSAPEAELLNMLEYALFPGGKRIRPRLLLSVGEAVGAELEGEIFLVTAALELIHSASLIHDDLPALDNDDLRRGKPTLHREFGEAKAILAADLLYAIAFRELVRGVAERPTVLQAVAEANAEVQRGQLLDVSNVVGLERIREVHRLKTASLFRAAAISGCAFARGGATATTLQLGATLGESYGLLFQAINDLQDCTLHAGSVGPQGPDLEAGRGTLRSLEKIEARGYLSGLIGQLRDTRERFSAECLTSGRAPASECSLTRLCEDLINTAIGLCEESSSASGV